MDSACRGARENSAGSSNNMATLSQNADGLYISRTDHRRVATAQSGGDAASASGTPITERRSVQVPLLLIVKH